MTLAPIPPKLRLGYDTWSGSVCAVDHNGHKWVTDGSAIVRLDTLYAAARCRYAIPQDPSPANVTWVTKILQDYLEAPQAPACLRGAWEGRVAVFTGRPIGERIGTFKVSRYCRLARDLKGIVAVRLVPPVHLKDPTNAPPSLVYLGGSTHEPRAFLLGCAMSDQQLMAIADALDFLVRC